MLSKITFLIKYIVRMIQFWCVPFVEKLKSLCVSLLNLNVAVFSTVFHLLTFNKTDYCALCGGETDISSHTFQTCKQSLGSCEY